MVGTVDVGTDSDEARSAPGRLDSFYAVAMVVAELLRFAPPTPASDRVAGRGIVQRINLALGWVLVWGVTGWLAGVFISMRDYWGIDCHAYWAALQGGPLYEGKPNELDAYLYSPAFAQALSPLGRLPWEVFAGAWLALGVASVLWLVRPLPPRWAVPAVLFAVPALVVGNVYIFFAVMVVLGGRYPAVWAFGVLTKVTPGVGIVWLLSRRDWRGAAIAVAVTCAVVGVSWAVTPGDWLAWLELLTSSTGGDPTWHVRVVAAVALAVVAARPGRQWLLAVAVVLASPVLIGPAAFVPLLAIPRLLRA